MITSLQETLAWRYATSQFDPDKKIPQTDLEAILAAGDLMPTAYGLQPFRIIVIGDQGVKDSLIPHSYGQEHIAKNSHLLVLAARTDVSEEMITEYVTRLENTRGLPPGGADGFKKMMVGDLTNRTEEARLLWAQKQCYIALGGMMAAASLRKVDNHALEGFNPAAYNEVLGLDNLNLHATVILALGYRSESDPWQHYAKVRLGVDALTLRR